MSDRGRVGEMTVSQSRLLRTQGYRIVDWPLPGPSEIAELQQAPRYKGLSEYKVSPLMSPERVETNRAQKSTAEVLQNQAHPSFVTFTTKKTVPLLGGSCLELTSSKTGVHPRISVIPTSYTDLYAELSCLMPDCEQTALCLVCGEVLNAGGKSECTKHSYKCGAGT
jgi:hypothetical protein